MTNLTSRNNPKIKLIHQLQTQRKQRDALGLFVVEGIRHVGEACEAHVSLEYLCYCPELLTSDFAVQLIEQQSRLEVPCLAVDKATFTHLAGKDNPQGILAVVRQPRMNLDDLSAETFQFGVALVAPQDPGNIGSILRTIDAVGASGLLLLNDPSSNQYSADPYHPNAVRASMGAIFWYPLVSTTFENFVRWICQHRMQLIGTSAHSSQDFYSVEKYEPPLVLLMGSEREGLTPSQTAVCDMVLSIPMRGRVTSLNLAIATGVMLYDIASKM